MRVEIIKTIKGATGVKNIHLETPENLEHGDYATNVAMLLFAKAKRREGKKVKKGDTKYKILNTKYDSPRELAKAIVKDLKKDKKLSKIVDKIEVAGPGFINFWLSKNALANTLQDIHKEKESFGSSDSLKDKKIMVEYAHPNTHKEMHIGHMRTLIVGESLARIFEAVGAKVFRANYQGDIGPHVAKSIWGTQKLLEERNSDWDEVEKLKPSKKARLLGEGYVKGNKEYERVKDEIDDMNIKLYGKVGDYYRIYKTTRKWSLNYYDTLWDRFDTKFDKLYFESEVYEKGKKIVEKNTGKVFKKSQGAVIFDGEKFGLHKRVFITKNGTATYEAKDMALAPLQHSDFPFDLNIHVVASEQTGYFEVVFKALELIDKNFSNREYHLPMGMVNLVGKKMSSRTGVIITVDGLLDDVEKEIRKLINQKGLTKKEIETIAEMATLAAVKYSVLSTGVKSNVLFDIKKSVSLSGNSGPYLQYTAARANSVLHRAEFPISNFQFSNKFQISKYKFNNEELTLLRAFPQFSEVIVDVTKSYSPNLLCTYLFDLAQKYNKFYNSHGILEQRTKNKEQSGFRIALTFATGQILKNGLKLLGIQAPQKM